MTPLRVALRLLLAALPLAAQAQATGPWYEVAEGAWRVPPATVTDMRRSIETAGRESARTATNQLNQKPRSIAADTVQYQGIRHPKTNRRLVQVYGMCETDKTPAQLRDFWAVVHDGGNCYYWARYDPVARRFVEFAFNESP